MPSNSNRSLAQVAADLHAQAEQLLIFERFLPAAEINQVCHDLGHRFRDRVYTPVVTLWMFLGQTLSPDHSCRDAVARLNAWRVENSKPKVDANTTSYCEARQRLPESVVAELCKRSAARCQKTARSKWQWKGRNVKIADGTTLTMPDTIENQKEYPQLRAQKVGCGFPIMRCVMLFCLATGAALEIAMAPYRGKETGENSLLQTIIDMLFPGEILLADRYYATFANIHRAYRHGYHVVMRAHHKRKIDFRKGHKQGSCDQIVAYLKPAYRSVWMSQENYDDLEDFVLVRHLRYRVERKGFRTCSIVLATTLLDASEYSVEDLADLYAQRWQVELDIRSLKTHMRMDHLRCKSPSMVRKEIYSHMISYNLIRDLIVRTALRYSAAPKNLSHTAAVQSLNAFSDKLQASSRRIEQLERALLESISEHSVGDRKPRVHPREIKRRPKPYKFMNRPRHAARRSAA